MKAAIIYSSFFDEHGMERKIGGIETYLINLAKILMSQNIKVSIYQWAAINFTKEVDGVIVEGVPVLQVPYNQRHKVIFLSVLKEIDPDEDIVIFGSDSQSVKSSCRRAISIQHGISWDLPVRFMTNHSFFRNPYAGRFYKFLIRRHFIERYERCVNRVCVDYNFINWYRTYLVDGEKGNNWVIPNFAPLATPSQISEKNFDSESVRIIFSRRFCEFRGTGIMSEAVRYLLGKYSNIEFTFAGDGPDSEWLKDFFVDEPRVKFIKYLPGEGLDVHLGYHIAVVPSLASEGTSLSVAEAMGAGCAIVATNVGGMTNMIIDGYNGLIVSPSTSDIVDSIGKIIKNPKLMRKLSENAYLVARESFSFEKWRERWLELIDVIAGE